MLRKTRSILFGALGIALTLATCVPAANGSVILQGDIFYSTFGQVALTGAVPPAATEVPCDGVGGDPAPGSANCFNVWKVHFVYSTGTPPTIVLTAKTGITLLCGADGLIFDPNTNPLKLLVGEQGKVCNQVAEMNQDGSGLIQVGSNGAPATMSAQAYSLVAQGGTLVTFPNDSGDTGFDKITTVPIPLVALGNGTAVTVTGDEATLGDGSIKSGAGLRGGALLGGTLYYGDALDGTFNGHFGILTLAGATTRFAVTDNSPGGGGANVSTTLPSHGVETDTFSGCIILSGSTDLWQLCNPTAPGGANTAQIVSKILNPSGDADANWDQTILDTAGHMFAADNNGNLLFVDFSGSTNVPPLIGDATKDGVQGKFFHSQHLSLALDDIAFTLSVATGCPATKGFWHNHGLPAEGQPTDPPTWPSNSVGPIGGAGGVFYNGTTHEMTIGGTKYTEAQLLPILTQNATGGNGIIIAGSQLIAAVLNIANGSPQPANVITAIESINNILTGLPQPAFSDHTPAKATNDQLKSAGATLDTYNGSASVLGCVEGASGT